MRRWLIGIIVVIALGAGGYFALDQYAQRRAPAEVDALIAANGLVSGTHGAVAYSLWNDRLTVEAIDLQATDPAALGWRKLHAAHLEIAGIDPLRIKAMLKGRWDALQRQPTPDRLEYSGFTLETSDGTVVSAALMAMVEPGFEAVETSSGIPVAMKTVTGLTARSLDITDVRISDRSPKGASDITADLLAARGIRKGRVESLDIRHMTTEGPGQPGSGPARMAIDRFSVSGLEHRNIIALAYDAQVRNEPLQALWDDITATGVSLGDQRVDMKFDRLTLGGVKAKRAGSWQEALVSLAAAKVELDALDAKVLKDRPGRIALSKLRFSGIEPGRIAGASLEGVAIEMAENEAKVTLATAELQDLAYGDWTRLGTPAPRMSLRHFGLGPLSVTQRGKEMGSMAGLNTLMTLDDNGLPVASSIKLDKLSLGSAILHQGPVGQEIAALGYNQLMADFSADGAYDAGTADMAVHETLLVGPQVGKVMISVKLNKVPTGLEGASQEEQLRRLFGMTLEKAEIRYEDDSLAERVLRRNAVKAGLTPEQMRDGVITQLRAIKQSLPPGSRTAAMIDAVAAFIQQPRSLILSLDPPRPVSVQQILGLAQSNPMEMPVLLGLSLH